MSHQCAIVEFLSRIFTHAIQTVNEAGEDEVKKQYLQQKSVNQVASCIKLYKALCNCFYEWLEAEEDDEQDFSWSKRGYYSGELQRHPSVQAWLTESDPFDVIAAFAKMVASVHSLIMVSTVSEAECLGGVCSGYGRVATFTLSCRRVSLPSLNFNK